MLEEIRKRISEAAHQNQKIAMFHYQVLLNAKDLTNADAVGFCNAVGVPESYATEFRKMLSLAQLMRDEKSSITVG